MKPTVPLAVALLVIPLGGCRITPEEIRVIEVENELLRQQITTVKENCEYYRELEIEADAPDE